MVNAFELRITTESLKIESSGGLRGKQCPLDTQYGKAD